MLYHLFWMQYAAIQLLLLASRSLGQQQCHEQACYRSARAQTAVAGGVTEAEAIIHSRCFAACVDLLETDSYCNGCDFDLQPSFLGQWNSLRFHELFDVDVSCTAVQKVVDCERGCFIRSTIPTLGDCRQQCNSECPTNYNNSDCAVNCRNAFCSYGCNIYNNEIRTEPQTIMFELAPIGVTSLNRDSGGLYVYDVGSGSMASNDSHWTQSMTTFIVRVMENGSTYYFWEPTSNGYLDLEFASCDNVSVSYQAVSLDRVTNYSPGVSFCVYGEKQYPGPVTAEELTFFYAEDFRDGYLGHTIVTLSWPRHEGFEHVSRYKLYVYPHDHQTGNCESKLRYQFTFERNTTDATIMSGRPDDPFSFQCAYHIRFTPEPTLTDELDLKPSSVSILTADTQPILSISCHSYVRPDGFIDIIAIWKLTDMPGVLESVDRFAVTTQLIDISHPTYAVIQTYKPYESYPNENETLHLANITALRPQINEDRKYRIRVDAISNHKYPWRLMPGYVTCVVDAHPEPPSLIISNKIKLHEMELTDQWLFINVSWEEPVWSHGDIIEYRIRIGREPYSSLTTMDFSYITSIEDSKLILNSSHLYELEDTMCYYLQISSQNNFAEQQWSNWSDPVTLYKYPDTLSCQKPSEPPVPTTILSFEPDETTPRPQLNKSTSLAATGIAIGVLIGVILLVVCMTIIIILGRRYHRRNRYLEAFRAGDQIKMYANGPKSPVETDISFATALNSPKLDEWEIPAPQVIIEDRLGEGCFGEVYRGMIKGPINNPRLQGTLKNAICPVVAIKILKSSASGSERTDFLQEIDTMKKVAKGNNPHIVNMIGCVTIQEPLCLITEFVTHGDLLSYLQSIRNMIMQQQKMSGGPEPYLKPTLDTDNGAKRMSIPMLDCDSLYADLGDIEAVNLLSFAYKIASGMEYLASLGIVHRDLACRNILIGEGKSLKISDFGMSRMVAADDVYVKNTRGRLPWKWMAIESIVNREFTSASDVWAYGVSLWEIATLGGFPYPTISNTELLEQLKKGLRLEKPDNCSPEVYEIMLQCWMASPQDRPTFATLRAKFDGLISAQKDHDPYIDLDIDSCKPYYSTLIESDDDEDEDSNNITTSTRSTECLSIAQDAESVAGCECMRQMLEKNPAELPRPVANAYVDAPTSTMVDIHATVDTHTPTLDIHVPLVPTNVDTTVSPYDVINGPYDLTFNSELQEEMSRVAEDA